MNVKQLKALVTDSVSQILGKEEIDSLDTYTISDMGKAVTSSPTSIQTWLHGLVSLLGKFVMENENFSENAKGLFVNDWEWGAYLERAYAEPEEFYDDLSWNLVDGQEYPAHVYYAPNMSAKIFDELKAIELRISIQTDKLKGAFKSWEDMNSFIGGIYNNVQNTINLGMRSVENMLIANGIAISDENTETAVHLLTEYNTLFSKSITAEDAIADDGFLRYTVQRIKNMRIQMNEPSIKYNDGTHVTSSEGHMKLFTLADYTTNLDLMLLGTVYGAQYYNIGEHKDVAYWQATDGESGDSEFKTHSSIKISADNNSKLGIGTTAYSQNYVIGFLMDDRALGYTFRRNKVTEEYTASGDFYTYYHKLSRNAITDTKFNMVAFIID